MEGNVGVAPPSGEVLALLTALSNPAGDHNRHRMALAAKDRALSSSSESYGNLCLNLVRILAFPDMEGVPENEMRVLKENDPTSVLQLQHDPMGGWLQLRQMAGLLLKNALLHPPPGMTLPPSFVVGELKGCLLQCLMDTHPAIRRVASSTISSSSVVSSSSSTTKSQTTRLALPLTEWPELMPFLVSCLEEGRSEVVCGGGLLTLSKLIEDAPSQLQQFGGPAYGRMVPLLLMIMRKREEERCRRDALTCLIGLIGTMPGELVVRMSELLEGLSFLAAHDPSVRVRQLVCRAITTLLSLRTEYLQPHMSSISEFMLTATSSSTTTTTSSPEVALEACEFWLTFASLDEDAITSDMAQVIRIQILPRLLPTLLNGMIYDMDKRQELLEFNKLESNEQPQQQQQQQRNQDLAPIFHKTKTKGTTTTHKTKRSSTNHHHPHDNNNNNNNNDDSDNDDTDDDDSDDDDDDEDDEEMNEWSLRKCSAASLDAMANLYGPEDVLPHLLPPLQESLSHEDPWIREAGVLALGAIAEGCEEALRLHLPQLHPYLMTQLTTPHTLPQLKSISAWTICRYANWAVDQVHSNTNPQPHIIGQMTQALLQSILHPNKRVQIASCSAFGVLIEAAQDLLCPYLQPILQTMVQAMTIYPTRSMMVLLDTMGTMSDIIGPAMGENNLPNIYIPPLLHMWTTIAKANPFDRTTLPLMETLASIALNIQIAFQPYALTTFETAMTIIESCLMHLATQQQQQQDNNNNNNYYYYYDEQDADPIICAIDLLDGMTEGLNVNFPSLVASSSRYSDHFLTLLHTLTGHDVPGVRMSAFALMGDLARQAPTLIQDGLGELLSEAIVNIDPIQPSVCNNAVWAIGEVCVKCQNNPQPFQPYAPDIVQNLITLLMGNNNNNNHNNHNNNDIMNHSTSMSIPGLAENAAATMGRLAKVSPNFVAPELSRFLPGWCDGMTKISDASERQDAFQGFLLSIHANPQSINQSSTNLVDTITTILFAIVSWHIPPSHHGEESHGKYEFTAFPSEHAELGQALVNFVQDLKRSATEQVWTQVQNLMPVNVRQLMRDVYHM